MLNKIFKTALRNIRKQKGYTFINIFGFTLGLTCALLILMYVVQEWSYDRFHDKADRIYRITFHGKLGQHEFESAASSSPAAAEFMQEFPQVETATRIDRMGEQVVRFGEYIFNERNLLRADPNFFDVFTFPLIAGEPKRVLTEPNTIVLSQRLAQKYFGDQSPVGEVLVIGKEQTAFRVTGVVKNPPQNSHFEFDALVSMIGQDRASPMQWLNFSLYTYILLKENSSIKSVEANLPALYEKYFSTPIQQVLQLSWEKFLEQGNDMGIVLQPLTSIHFDSHFNDEIKPAGSKSNILLFSLIALFVLLIACINYMNLTTARSASRAKEVGVRKVVGANRSSLIRQFLGESLLLAALSMILSLGFVELLLPTFNELSGIQFSSGLFLQGWMIAGLLGLTLLIGFLAGSYPAFVLTLYQLIEALRTKDPGIKHQGLLAIELANADSREKNQLLKTEFLHLSRVNKATACSAVPLKGLTRNGYFPEGMKTPMMIHVIDVDRDFIDLFELDVVQGRNFEQSTDRDDYLINESLAHSGQKRPVPPSALGRTTAAGGHCPAHGECASAESSGGESC